jgi:hypothetical protein
LVIFFGKVDSSAVLLTTTAVDVMVMMRNIVLTGKEGERVE